MSDSENENLDVIKKVFDGPGRGRKQCKSCQAYVGVRSAICVCGASFGGEKEKPAPMVRVLQEKPSPQVKAPQEKMVSSTPAQAPAPVPLAPRLASGKAPLLQKGNQVTIVPAGPCPVKLKEIDSRSVIDWSREVQEKYSSTLTPFALRYWARTQFNDPRDPKYLKVAEILREEYGD
jgi:hypothetical protein